MAEIEVAPQFGVELKDGFKPVNAWVSNGITWLDDVQQFYRERSVIEKEYSAKLSALAKRYFEKKAKRSSSLSVGDTPVATPGSLESASMTTWNVQLTTLESRAAEHDRFATELTQNLAEPLKVLSTRCEELRKQHADYATKLEKERDTSYAELRKTKTKYDAVCQDVENRRKKVDGDGSKQKAQGAYHQQLSDMYNTKNSYLLNINVTNKQKERYYHDYVPELIDGLQDLSESRVSKLNAIWLQAALIENGTLSRSMEYMKHLSMEIPRNKPVLDSMMFVRHNTSAWQEPTNFTFEPSPVWLDDSAMASNDTAKVFLRNVLGKSKDQLGELRRETDKKKKEVDAMKRTKQNIRSGKDKQKDEVEVARALFALQEELHDVERRKTTAEVEVSTIVAAVGDVSIGARNHNFKSQTYKIPTSCDLCGDRLWGLSAKGFDCQDCGYTCHTKCEMKVPADCPGEKTKEEKRSLKVARQEAAHTVKIEEPVPERKPSAAISRRDTVDSMNTLSSGYAASANRSVSDIRPSTDGIDEPKIVIAPPMKPGPRKMAAPPPSQYIKAPEVDNEEPKGKMLYAYQKNGEGELSIHDGQSVIILEPDDGSGWIKVRANRESGLVPASYVELSPHNGTMSDADRRSVYSASSTSLAGSITSAITGKKKGPAVAPKRGAKKLKHVEALYAYEARSDAEHSMNEGERLVLINQNAGDGWSDVEKNGFVKSVPANYLQDVM